MCARHVGERPAVAGQREPRRRAPRPCRARPGTRPPGRACSRRRSRARRGRAGGRRRSAAGARAGRGRRARARGRASRRPATGRGRCRPSRRRSARDRPAASPAWPVPWPRRCSIQRRSGASGTPLWRAISTRRASVCSRSSADAVWCAWFGCIQTSQPARSAIGGAWPQWSTCACVQTISRTCSIRRRAWSSARSRCAIEPGSCMPVSTSTIPSPAASAHALQCGTPGHGSGSRRRQTPGRTRSPRPTSRLRVGLRTARHGNVAAPDADAERQDCRRQVLRRARPPRRGRRWRRCGRRTARSTSPARSTRSGRRACARTSPSCSRAFPDFALTVQSTTVAGRPRRRALDRDRRR